MYGKRFVLNIETNSLKLAFVIVAGTRSRGGAMWFQFSIPITRQAVQIHLLFITCNFLKKHD